MAEKSSPAESIRVVGALVRRGGRILLTRRPPGRSHAGSWEFPGGKVHPGESDAAALVRELREELGIDAAVTRHYATISHDYGHFHITLVILECEIDAQEPACLEVAEIAWAPPEALLDYTLTPADVPVAEQLIREAALLRSSLT